MQRNPVGRDSPYRIPRFILAAAVRADRPLGPREVFLLAVRDPAEGHTWAGAGRYRSAAEAAPVSRIVVRMAPRPLPELAQVAFWAYSAGHPRPVQGKRNFRKAPHLRTFK